MFWWSLTPSAAPVFGASLLAKLTKKRVKHSMPKSNRSSKKAKVSKSETPDYSEIPELGQSFWRRARVNIPLPKQAISLRVDQDVLDFFRSTGKGYQSLMNAVLRSYVEAKKNGAS